MGKLMALFFHSIAGLVMTECACAAARDLVVGGVQPPTVFTTPPQLFLRNLSGGGGFSSTPQLWDMQVKSEQQLSDRETGKLSQLAYVYKCTICLRYYTFLFPSATIFYRASARAARHDSTVLWF